MNAMKPVFEKRRIEGRHGGIEFSVEAWLREGSEAFVHRIQVDGIPVPSGHLKICIGLTAALEAGAHLARSFIDSGNL